MNPDACSILGATLLCLSSEISQVDFRVSLFSDFICSRCQSVSADMKSDLRRFGMDSVASMAILARDTSYTLSPSVNVVSDRCPQKIKAFLSVFAF